MKKKELKKEIENLKKSNSNLLSRLKENERKQIQEKITLILSLATELDSCAVLNTDFETNDFGTKCECSIKFNYYL